ncbi:chemotaxis protein CheW [Clostridium sp. E02]|uniref:chemotaxis protein CheW n=1 Tax=Clostridium sp. E02 TaxID=2487134 RepID=UPI000F536787|nr:chemotaxis protein CheW [Clostridium sp. E02]
MENGIKYPYILFKIADSTYCINSKHIATIVQLPEYSEIPSSPDNVTGMFKYRDRVIQMLDLRITLGLKPISEECKEFEQMIDARKQDHIQWVKELERFINEGGSFNLAKDPHQCALGKWYDSFTTDNAAVIHHLKKIEEPHCKLHKAAEEAEMCMKNCKECQREECLFVILSKVKNESMPTILKLLDQTKELFQSTLFKEMVLILDDTNWGIVVDEILAVEDLNILSYREKEPIVEHCSYINRVMEREKEKGLIFELNIDNLSAKLLDLESYI